MKNLLNTSKDMKKTSKSNTSKTNKFNKAITYLKCFKNYKSIKDIKISKYHKSIKYIGTIIISLLFILGNNMFGFKLFADEIVDVSLDLSAGQITIGSPATIEFPESSGSSTGEVKTITLSGSEYFWVEDLKSSPTGFHVTIQMGELYLSTNTGKYIDGDAIEAKIATGIVVIEGSAQGVVIPSGAQSSFTSIGTNPLTIMQRESDIGGVVGKFGVYPTLKLNIPAYQTLGNYEGVLTYTLLESW